MMKISKAMLFAPLMMASMILPVSGQNRNHQNNRNRSYQNNQNPNFYNGVRDGGRGGQYN